MSYPTTDIRLSGDVLNLLRGLALAAQSIPPGDYRAGYEAAITVVATALGVDSAPASTHHDRGCDYPHAVSVVDITPRLRREDTQPVPSGKSRCTPFEGIENVPWAIGAFANIGR